MSAESQDGARSLGDLANSDAALDTFDEVRERSGGVATAEDRMELEEARQHLETTPPEEDKSIIEQRAEELIEENPEGVIPPTESITVGSTIIGDNVEGGNLKVAKPNSVGQIVLEEALDERAGRSTRQLVNYLSEFLAEWIEGDEGALDLAVEYNATELAILHQELIQGGNLGR